MLRLSTQERARALGMLQAGHILREVSIILLHWLFFYNNLYTYSFKNSQS